MAVVIQVSRSGVCLFLIVADPLCSMRIRHSVESKASPEDRQLLGSVTMVNTLGSYIKNGTGHTSCLRVPAIWSPSSSRNAYVSASYHHIPISEATERY